MASLNGFDASTIEPNNPPDPIPAGKYLCQIINSEFKATKQGDGEYLEIELEVIGGAYRGRKVWDRLNLKNPSQKAVEIAHRNLSAICHAVGVLRPKDSIDLHNIPLGVKVALKKRSDNDELANEVKGYLSRSDLTSRQASSADSPQPPWHRGDNSEDIKY